MEFLNEYHLAGLFIGICTFLIIGLFHPVVVKAEYYWSTKCWWIFLILGIGGVIAQAGPQTKRLIPKGIEPLLVCRTSQI